MLSDRQAEDIYRAAVRQKYEAQGIKIVWCDNCSQGCLYLDFYPLKDGKCKICRGVKHG